MTAILFCLAAVVGTVIGRTVCRALRAAGVQL